MKPVFIIGYMASGKTTLGRALARELGRQFIDMDYFIEQRFRKPVAELFAEKGEEWFRRIEAGVLRELGEWEDTVISCGGGTPCFEENMEFMNQAGITVWVTASIEKTLFRLSVAKVKRPLVEGKSPEELASYITAHLQSRIPFYSQARIEFEGEHLENKKEISKSVSALLPLLNTV